MAVVTSFEMPNTPNGKFLSYASQSRTKITRSGNKPCLEVISYKKFTDRKIQQAMTSFHSPQQLWRCHPHRRKQIALTQPQLALAAGVGVRFVVELEAGKSTVRLAQVLRVIQALGGEIHIHGLPAAGV
ncbi:MAG: helix-turn-helix transcriptional regulator [Limnohabitans sp.]